MKESGLPQGLKGKFNEVENELTFKHLHIIGLQTNIESDTKLLIDNNIDFEIRNDGTRPLFKITGGLEQTDSEIQSDVDSWSSFN